MILFLRVMVLLSYIYLPHRILIGTLASVVGMLAYSILVKLAFLPLVIITIR